MFKKSLIFRNLTLLLYSFTFLLKKINCKMPCLFQFVFIKIQFEIPKKEN